jgi:formate hydrogenlyase subunit 4
MNYSVFAASKLLVYTTIGIALFVPWGIAQAGHWLDLPVACFALLTKLLVAGMGLALLETVLAKLRLLRAPEFLTTAFLLAAVGLLVHFMIEV